MAEVNLEDEGTVTCLHQYAAKGSESMVRASLQKKAFHVDVRTRSGATPLILACRGGWARVCIELVRFGASVNAVDSREEKTALHEAAAFGSMEVCRLLLENGAVVDSKTKTGDTPLHKAAWKGQREAGRVLLEWGADVKVTNGEGKTPEFIAAKYDHNAMAKFLMDVSDDLHIMSAIGGGEEVRKLLEGGTDVNCRNDRRETPLMVASRAGKVGVCKVLIDWPSCQFGTKDSEGRAALHLAARWGHLDTCRLLLDKGAEVDIKTKSMDTPLHLAALGGHLEVVMFLLQNKADPQPTNGEGKTPACVANLKGHTRVYNYLMKHLETSTRRIMTEENVAVSGSENHFVSQYLSTFETESRLGHGGFGHVIKAKLKLTPLMFAVKKVRLPAEQQQREVILREVRLLSILNHENIIKLYSTWEEHPPCWAEKEIDAALMTYDRSTPQGQEASKRATEYFAAPIPVTGPTTSLLFMQLELCREETLGHKLDKGQKLAKFICLTYFHQAMTAVSYLHSQRLIHRDLKPHNILFSLDGKSVKIGDFGLSTSLFTHPPLPPPSTSHHPGHGHPSPPIRPSQREVSSLPLSSPLEMTVGIGTHLYSSPEQISGREYGQKSDVFSMGLVLYEMLAPFGGDKDGRTQAFTSLRSGDPFTDDFTSKNADETRLIQKMLTPDPSSRVSAYYMEQQVQYSLDRKRQIQSHPKQYLFACKTGVLSEVEEWVDVMGVDILGTVDEFGMSGIHLASASGHTEVVSFLLDKGMEVDIENRHGLTPLHCAAKSGHQSTALILLKSGADPRRKDEYEMTPGELASFDGHKSISLLLKDFSMESGRISANDTELSQSVRLGLLAGDLYPLIV